VFSEPCSFLIPCLHETRTATFSLRISAASGVDFFNGGVTEQFSATITQSKVELKLSYEHTKGRILNAFRSMDVL
jgi:hypothetical protein